MVIRPSSPALLVALACGLAVAVVIAVASHRLERGGGAEVASSDVAGRASSTSKHALVEARDEAQDEEGAPRSSAQRRLPVAVARALPIAVGATHARIVGTVVDAFGAPRIGVGVRALPLGATEPGRPVRAPAEAFSGKDGRFELERVGFGPVLLSLQAELGAPASRRLGLDPDAALLDVGAIVVDAVERRSGPGVSLRSAAGRTLADPELLRVRSLDGRGEKVVEAPLRRSWHAPEDAPRRVQLGEIPLGGAEVSLIEQDGALWTPSAIVVHPGDDEIAFTRRDDVPLESIAFEVARASDGEKVGNYEAWIRVGAAPPRCIRRATTGPDADLFTDVPAWIRALALPQDAAFTWTVSAPGMRAESGDRSAFDRVVREEASFRDPSGGSRRETRETRIATVELRAGFSAHLSFRDFGAGPARGDDDGLVHALSARPVDGVEVRADGRVVATSIGGAAWIDLDAEPVHLAFESPGWTLVETDAFQNGRIAGAARDVVIWLVRD